jgi:hypothetical protein
MATLAVILMERPTTVTVFGILNIVFAVLGVFGIFASIALLAAGANSSATSANPMVNIMRENPAFATWMKISIPLGFLTCIALLIAGIGLLKMKDWARQLSIGYSVFAIVSGLVGMVLTYVWVTRPILDRMSGAQGPEAAGAIGGAVGGVIGGCFSLIYPIVLLIFMMRPKVVAAFRPATPPSMPPA